MKIFQEAAVDLAVGVNFLPQRMRYKFPQQKNDVSIYLLSDSFEYDIQMIKNAPLPKTDYKNMIIPYKVIDRFGNKIYRYLSSQNEFNRKVTYINKHKLVPNVVPIRYPFPKVIIDNLYIPMAEIIPTLTPNIRGMSSVNIQSQIFDIFNKFMNHHNFSKRKILFIDTQRYTIYKNPTIDTYQSDLINALLTAYIYLPPEKIKKLNWTFVFRGKDADYKFDLMNFEKRDIPRMRKMLEEIGKENPTSAHTNEEAGESSDDFTKETPKEPPILDSEEENDVDADIQIMQNLHRDPTANINSTIRALKKQYNIEDKKEDEDEKRKEQLYQAKTINVNAELLGRINNIRLDIDKTENYEHISSEITPIGIGQVEKETLKQAAKKLADTSVVSNTNDELNAVSSAREEEIRKKIGQLKLNNISFDSLTSITDVPLPKPVTPNHITTTNAAARRGSAFASVTEEYEEKLLDRDIVATFMNFSKLPDGFYVANVEVTDISTVTSLMNNWRVTLKNKNTDRQSIINIRIPKVMNGRFYNNGIWYNIGKQDFPIPILKINKKTVMITSNYQKITVERYDTKSLVDISMLVKVIDKVTTDGGRNKYIKGGISTHTNSQFVSTIEYDEYAQRWLHFINKEAKLEIYFNRVQCLKAYSFVTVNQNEFCCGMINQVPIVLNTETGLTRDGRTLTDIMLSSLPEHLQLEYKSQKPGKLSMYTSITIGVTLPLGVGICAWEGMTSLLKKSGCKYQYVDKAFSDTHYFTIPFKDKVLAIENTITNQLIFNGFYRINTKSYTTADFEVPIMSSNSVFVDIFNQYFFKQYSQLTTFITYYHFFVDAITADVCDHYHIPNDIAGMLIYASNLLADNNHSSENNAALYRIRSSEIIPAIIHYRLAFAISKYNNASGSKSRDNKLAFNPNEVINELLNVPNVEPMSALNPVVELHMRENITKKGFKGVNSDRSYTVKKRSYEDSMVGKMAISSPNNGTVGVTRQLVADPKITSVRGYTSTDGIEGNYNDLQLASFSELLTPGSVSRDDAIRTAMATSQSSHLVPIDGSQPVLISNGVDEIVPAYLTEEFSYVAKEDGTVLDLNEDYLVIKYKSGTKKAVHVGHKQSFNSGSGFYVDNHLETNVQKGDTFKRGDILAYHSKFFTKDSDGVIRMNIGPLTKVAFLGTYATYEDAGVITESMSKRLRSSLSMAQIIKINATDDIDKIVEVGTEVEIGDPLIVFGLGDTGDKAVDNFLKAFQTAGGNNAIDMTEKAKRVITAKHAGTVVDIKMYTCKSMDKLSSSLFKIFDKYFKDNVKKRQILDKYDKTNSVYKMGTLYELPTEPLKGSTIKGITTDVLVEIYIEHADEASVGDKVTLYGANKNVISEVVPAGKEPYSESEPNEEISMFVTPGAVMKRMVPSVIIAASGNKVLVDLKKQIKQIWERQ